MGRRRRAADVPPHTGWEALDDYGAHYYVFFLTGYMLAPKVFQLAAWARENVSTALIGLSGWFVFNATIAFKPSGLPGIDTFAQIPGLRIAFGLIGAMAVVTIAALLSRLDAARFIRYAGRNSIVLYVSFVLPMAATRILLLKSGLITDVGVVSLIVWGVAAVVPLALHALVRNTWARFLYERPDALKIERRQPRDRRRLPCRTSRPARPGAPAHRRPDLGTAMGRSRLGGARARAGKKAHSKAGGSALRAADRRGSSPYIPRAMSTPKPPAKAPAKAEAAPRATPRRAPPRTAGASRRMPRSRPSPTARPPPSSRAATSISSTARATSSAPSTRCRP